MKFALNTTDDDLRAAAAALATEHGFDGLEIAGAGTAGDRLLLDAGNVEVACVSTEISMPAARRARAAQADQLCRHVDAAADAKCRRVRLLDAQPVSGHATQATAVEMGEWLLPLADYAAERNVTLLVENQLAFRKARQLWTVFETATHPNVAAAWDVDSALAVGESPAVSVPTLNSRIQWVRLRHTSPDDAVEQLLTRLRGVGYRGYVSIQAPPDALAGTLAKVRAWAQPPASAKVVKPVRA